MKARKIVYCIALVSIFSTALAWSNGTPEPDRWLPHRSQVILSAGQRDNSSTDLSDHGFRAMKEYQLFADQNRYPSKFPQGMFYGRNNICPVLRDADIEVPKLVIHFTLKRTRRDVVLRMARAGSETSIVKFDNRRTYRVTSAILRSNEGNIFGQYDVHFGKTRAGSHTVTLTVDPNDGAESVKDFGWDALVLFWR